MSIKEYIKPLKTAVVFSLAMFLICGLAYPYALTGIAQLVFPSQANGSLIYENGEAVGSELVGQDFTDARFMKCRPSAVNYNTYSEADKASGEYGGVASGSQNFAQSNPDLAARIAADTEEFLKNNETVSASDIPADIVTASGSGLDPHISPKAAELQITALAKNTGMTEENLKEIVKNNTSGKLLGIFGEETVNVLKVNLEIAKAIGII